MALRILRTGLAEPATMGMKQTLAVVNALEADGIIGRYAISGAIYSYLKARGYEEHRREGVVIEGWPVQFLPVAGTLDADALAQATEMDIQFGEMQGSVRTRILRPEHLVATALRVGRPKDLIRITQFLEERAVDLKVLCELLGRHGLREMWRAFCGKAGIVNPCDV
jgi:hypothetical protein